MVKGCYALSLLLLVLLQSCCTGTEGASQGGVRSAAQPTFEAVAPMELFHSQLMNAHMSVELSRLESNFEHNFSRFGIEGNGYSDVKVRQLAVKLEALGEKAPLHAVAETTPDAGQCQRDTSAELLPSTPAATKSDVKTRVQIIHQKQQNLLLSNCTLAEQVELVFLGDSLLHRWGGMSFEALCGSFSGACANLGIPGQKSSALLQQARELVATTCLAPRAWVLFSGANEIADSDGQSTSKVVEGLTTTVAYLQEASCHSDVLVVGVLPMAAGFGGSSSFRITSAVSLINRNLSSILGDSYIDCGNDFMTTSGALIDGIHPSSAGYAALSKCLLPRVNRLTDRPKPTYRTNHPSAMVHTNALKTGEFNWVYSDWTCDVACGQGIATRNVSCTNARTLEQADSQRCNQDALQPLVSNCNRGHCPQFAWVSGRWGDCDKNCGGGVALRTVECINSLNEVADAALCYSSATGQRPSTWKRCNPAPCPLTPTLDTDREAFYEEVNSGVSEQLGLSDSSDSTQISSDMMNDETHSESNTEGKVPPILMKQALPTTTRPQALVGSLSGVSIMTRSDESDSDDSSSSDDDEASSDDGNGEPYKRKTLRELLVCYRDSDCGSGYECEPFTCSKACAVYTNGQRVSSELRNRYAPEPPSFVYQMMYQAMVFRGTGGICYRKCHHMTDCNRRNSDGTCREWFCRKVEGCHNYPSDYHVPSLEECGVNGLCRPGKCRRRGSRSIVEPGVSVNSAVEVSSPTACPGRSLPSVSGCCGSGVVSHNGTCCESGAQVDKDGGCCPADKLDACGVCGGPSTTLDILGQCCTTALDANGVCCPAGRQIDECGVCGGWNASCAMTPTFTLAATSMVELEQRVHLQLPQELVDAAGDLGFKLNDISVYNLTVGSMGEYNGPVSAEVTYKIIPDSGSTTMGSANFKRKTSGLGQLTSVERVGVCGNGMCEVGEQTRDGWDGTCPADCSWTGYVPCNCNGHGVCTAATGSCACHTGYAGPACSWCDDGYISVGDDADEGRALCVPEKIASSMSTKVLRKGGLMDWTEDTVDMDDMDASASPSSKSSTVAVGLVVTACILVVALGFAVLAHLIRRQQCADPMPHALMTHTETKEPPSIPEKPLEPSTIAANHLPSTQQGTPSQGRTKRYLVPAMPN